MSQDARSVNRRFVEEYQTKGDRAVGEELLGANFVDHTPFPGIPPTREGVLMLFDAMRAGFPDLRAQIHMQVLEDDTVATTSSTSCVWPTGRSSSTGTSLTRCRSCSNWASCRLPAADARL